MATTMLILAKRKSIAPTFLKRLHTYVAARYIKRLNQIPSQETGGVSNKLDRSSRPSRVTVTIFFDSGTR